MKTLEFAIAVQLYSVCAIVALCGCWAVLYIRNERRKV